MQQARQLPGAALVIMLTLPRYVLLMVLHAFGGDVMAQDAGLREMFLNGSEDELGVTFPDRPWLVIMETGIENGSYTVLATHDGTTSIYFSNGGGIIGAGEHPEIAARSKSLVRSIAQYEKYFTSVPVAGERPGAGQTVFYFRKGKGLLQFEASEQTLGEGESPLSTLFYEVHDLISAVRHATPQNDD